MRRVPTLTLILLLPIVVLKASCNPIPTKQQPAAYVQILVNDAIYFCNKNGRETAAKQFSSFEQVDGQWYVFIFDENSSYLAALFTRLIGRDFSRRKDVNDINCSAHIARVMTAGKWFSYFFPNPKTNEQQTKHAWFIRHDGLVFASGYYE